MNQLLSNSLKSRIKHWIYSGDKLKRLEANEELSRLKRLPRYQPTETFLLGKRIKIPDAASFLFLQHEIFTNEIYKFKSSRSSPFIVDGGANIGISTIYFKTLYPSAKIFAFEPDPQIFGILKHNLSVFQLTDVELIAKALWSSETSLNFNSEGADAGHISIYNKDQNVIPVITTRLSYYLDRKIDLLKLDIEGAEFEVIKECKDSLVNVEHIFIEYHSFSNQEQFLPELLDILKRSGFRLYITIPGLCSKNPFDQIDIYLGMDLQINIFGIRQK